MNFNDKHYLIGEISQALGKNKIDDIKLTHLSHFLCTNKALNISS